MKIYLASSWRNAEQQTYVQVLRALGHDVYDFKNPTRDFKPGKGGGGFSWKSIDKEWENWTPAAYRNALKHSLAKEGYVYDITALRACDACVLLLPSGRSASWEFGCAMCQGKKAYVIMPEACEPELMYLEAEILVSLPEVITAFK